MLGQSNGTLPIFPDSLTPSRRTTPFFLGYFKNGLNYYTLSKFVFERISVFCSSDLALKVKDLILQGGDFKTVKTVVFSFIDAQTNAILNSTRNSILVDLSSSTLDITRNLNCSLYIMPLFIRDVDILVEKHQSLKDVKGEGVKLIEARTMDRDGALFFGFFSSLKTAISLFRACMGDYSLFTDVLLYTSDLVFNGLATISHIYVAYEHHTLIEKLENEFSS